ncbi:MAG TPA: LytR family transcriptional regulator [Armatimonadetes bacterium]|nr:LytR family transcriptional regulator [Armatimonadota bacterium]
MGLKAPNTARDGKKGRGALVWAACALAVLSGLAGVYSAMRSDHNPAGSGPRIPFISPPFGGERLVLILVLGADDRGGKRGRADVVMLVLVGPRTGRVAVLHIPRDSRVIIPGHGVDKINAAYALGGPELARETVEYLIGEPIDFYIKLNVEEFRKLVDLVGGVDLYVEKDMRYVDRSQGLYINLKRGYQHLDGEKAMQYVRFRHDRWGDIGRIERQKKFLKALAKKLLSPRNLPKLPKIVIQARECVETNMSAEDMLDLVRVVRKTKPEEVPMETLPGRPASIRGISYWIIDEGKACDVLSRLLVFVQSPQVELSVRVEVLNGCGVPGIATKVAEVLRLEGFEVERVDNADRYDYDATLLLVRGGNISAAEEIRRLLGCGEIRKAGKEGADVTVIVGRDLANSILGGGS